MGFSGGVLSFSGAVLGDCSGGFSSGFSSGVGGFGVGLGGSSVGDRSSDGGRVGVAGGGGCGGVLGVGGAVLGDCRGGLSGLGGGFPQGWRGGQRRAGRILQRNQGGDDLRRRQLAARIVRGQRLDQFGQGGEHGAVEDVVEQAGVKAGDFLLAALLLAGGADGAGAAAVGFGPGAPDGAVASVLVDELAALVPGEVPLEAGEQALQQVEDAAGAAAEEGAGQSDGALAALGQAAGDFAPCAGVGLVLVGFVQDQQVGPAGMLLSDVVSDGAAPAGSGRAGGGFEVEAAAGAAGVAAVFGVFPTGVVGEDAPAAGAGLAAEVAGDGQLEGAVGPFVAVEAVGAGGADVAGDAGYGPAEAGGGLGQQQPERGVGSGGQGQGGFQVAVGGAQAGIGRGAVGGLADAFDNADFGLGVAVGDFADPAGDDVPGEDDDDAGAVGAGGGGDGHPGLAGAGLADDEAAAVFAEVSGQGDGVGALLADGRLFEPGDAFPDGAIAGFRGDNGRREEVGHAGLEGASPGVEEVAQGLRVSVVHGGDLAVGEVEVADAVGEVFGFGGFAVGDFGNFGDFADLAFEQDGREFALGIGDGVVVQLAAGEELQGVAGVEGLEGWRRRGVALGPELGAGIAAGPAAFGGGGAAEGCRVVFAAAGDWAGAVGDRPEVDRQLGVEADAEEVDGLAEDGEVGQRAVGEFPEAAGDVGFAGFGVIEGDFALAPEDDLLILAVFGVGKAGGADVVEVVGEGSGVAVELLEGNDVGEESVGAQGGEAAAEEAAFQAVVAGVVVGGGVVGVPVVGRVEPEGVGAFGLEGDVFQVGLEDVVEVMAGGGGALAIEFHAVGYDAVGVIGAGPADLAGDGVGEGGDGVSFAAAGVQEVEFGNGRRLWRVEAAVVPGAAGEEGRFQEFDYGQGGRVVTGFGPALWSHGGRFSWGWGFIRRWLRKSGH